MKKRMISLLLALVMILGMIPATAITANALTYELADAVIVNNVGLDDGYYVLEGSTEAKEGTPPADADYAYFKDQVLYLKNFDITTYRENRVSAEKVVKCGIGMYQYVNLYWDDSYLGSLINDFPLTIHLTGTNRITDSLAEYSIYACYEATVTFTGDGTLEMNRPMEVSAGTTVKSGAVRMTESGAGDKVPMIKTENFKMEGGELNMRAAYRSGIECTGFAMSSGKLDVTVLGNSQYTGSGLLTTGSVTFSGGTAKIQSDGDAVQCSSLTIQDGVENVKFISTAASEQDGNYMAVDASFVTLPTQLTTYVSDNADGNYALVVTSGSLNGYDSVEIAALLSGKISGVTSTTETLVHIYETGNGVPLEIISVIGNGTYSFLVPQFGDYTILAIARGYEQQTAKITVSGNTTQNFAMVEKPKFTIQPQGGTVVYNQRHIAKWATNFTPVKQELVTYNPTGNVLQVLEISAGAVLASLSYLSDGYYYRIRSYYDYYSNAYVESDSFYVTTDPYFTPNYEHGNTEMDIIAGITYVPNGDGTFNANVHVDLSYVDGQMLQHEWYGTGYYWYDHNNKLTSGIGTTDTDKLVFTLYNVGKNLVPGKEWRVKVYLAYDPYCDDEWREVDFHYVTDTVPELKPEDAFTNPFTDVKEGDFYYDPVMWAVENGITTGATATTFNPGGNCLRAHVVTFLHRAEGNPEPTSTKNPFTDVKTSDFFYKPVLWAVEKKITNGTSATTFGSYDNCNRAAVVTFLWRNAGSPEPKSTNNPFVDVKSTDFFYKPVLWAVEEGITNGLDATHFGPATACNRAQVVTFLYRAYN